MRFLGNKTKLLTDIQSFLFNKGVREGVFIDVFTGSASVARHFKKNGFQVYANDLLSSCFTQAVASLEVSKAPLFLGLFQREKKVFTSQKFIDGFLQTERLIQRKSLTVWIDSLSKGSKPKTEISPPDLPLRLVLYFLQSHLKPTQGFFTRNYSPLGPEQRMYFREGVAEQIDAVSEFIRDCHLKDQLTRAETHFLLSILLDAADRRANISGTYGAFLKHWQSNTAGDLELRIPEIIESSLEHKAFQDDANELIPNLEGDILYLDPPYNNRQYAANYHVLEILAEYHRIEDLDSYEALLYGKTGLRPYDDLKSDYCVGTHSRKKNQRNVKEAFRDLLLNSKVEHILVSYNEEGLLSKSEMGEVLAEFSGDSRYDYRKNFLEIDYQRFRSDRDRPGETQGKRVYKVVEGKERNRIGEWLFYAQRSKNLNRISTTASTPSGSKVKVKIKKVSKTPSRSPKKNTENRNTENSNGKKTVFKEVLILSNSKVEECEKASKSLIETLKAQGLKVHLKASKKAESSSDLIIVLGGDGFLMESIRKLDYPETPIFGVNFGNVGFLMNSKSTLDTLAERIQNQAFDTMEYPLIKAEGENSKGETVSKLAFNDITLERMSGQSIHFLARVDNVPFNNFAGDGIIIATPGGSTAYNLAAGGPVVHPNIPAMVITPLYPHRAAPFHSLQFSLVLGLNQTLTIEGQGVGKRPIRLLVDGRDQGDIKSVNVCGSDKKIKLLRDPDRPFFSSLTTKFMGELPEE